MNRILTITSRLVPGAPAQFSGKPIWGENHNLVTGTDGKVGVGMGILRDCELCPLTRCLEVSGESFCQKTRACHMDSDFLSW